MIIFRERRKAHKGTFYGCNLFSMLILCYTIINYLANKRFSWLLNCVHHWLHSTMRYFCASKKVPEMSFLLSKPPHTPITTNKRYKNSYTQTQSIRRFHRSIMDVAIKEDLLVCNIAPVSGSTDLHLNSSIAQ